MAGSVNKVTLLGNLGRDPEVRSSQDGSKIVSFSVATTESWRDKSTGDRKDRTEWQKKDRRSMSKVNFKPGSGRTRTESRDIPRRSLFLALKVKSLCWIPEEA